MRHLARRRRRRLGDGGNDDDFVDHDGPPLFSFSISTLACLTNDSIAWFITARSDAPSVPLALRMSANSLNAVQTWSGMSMVVFIRQYYYTMELRLTIPRARFTLTPRRQHFHGGKAMRRFLRRHGQDIAESLARFAIAATLLVLAASCCAG